MNVKQGITNFVILSAGTSNKVKMTECDGDIRKEDGACVLQTRKLFEKDKNQRPRASINITRLNPRRKLSRILSEVETLVSFMSDKYSVDQAQAFLIHIEKWKNKLKAMEGRFREGVVINIPTCDSVLLGKSAIYVRVLINLVTLIYEEVFFILTHT